MKHTSKRCSWCIWRCPIFTVWRELLLEVGVSVRFWCLILPWKNAGHPCSHCGLWFGKLAPLIFIIFHHRFSPFRHPCFHSCAHVLLVVCEVATVFFHQRLSPFSIHVFTLPFFIFSIIVVHSLGTPCSHCGYDLGSWHIPFLIFCIIVVYPLTLQFQMAKDTLQITFSLIHSRFPVTKLTLPITLRSRGQEWKPYPYGHWLTFKP